MFCKCNFLSVIATQKIQLNKYVSSKKDSNRTYFILQFRAISVQFLNKLSKEQKISDKMIFGPQNFLLNQFLDLKFFVKITFDVPKFRPN